MVGKKGLPTVFRLVTHELCFVHGNAVNSHLEMKGVLMSTKKGLFTMILSTLILSLAGQGNAATLFQENFEDGNFSARGWYDNSTPKLSSTEHVANSTKSLEFHFAKGAVTPDLTGSSMRKKFVDSDSVYISYYVKHSASWVGSGVSYHPHIFYFLTNKDTDWTGPAYTHLTLYLEELAGKPQILIQDGVNIDLTNIGKNLTGTTEKRAVAGCNGDSDGYGNGDCYANGSVYWNGKTMWKAGSDLFSSTAGPYYKGDWHLVEAYVKMNSIVNGTAAKDGVLQYWYDGNSMVKNTNMVFRTGQYPDMKFNQLLIGPYIGVGSPVDQSMWIDNLIVANGVPSKLSPPQNLRIVVP